MIQTIVYSYQDLFTTSNPASFDEVLDTIPQVVTQEMNDLLAYDFTMEEVELALKQMAPLKSPRLDGMPPLFYQSFRSFLGSNVTHSILHYLNSGTLPALLCYSYISLIPKVKKPEYVF